MDEVIVSPSILDVSEDELKKCLPEIITSGAKWIHVDVMDGKFVPHLAWSLDQFKRISKLHNLVNDVHIMIEKPFNFVKEWVNAGADILTFHLEACCCEDKVNQIIDMIHSLGAKAGISIKPETPIESVYPFLKKVDLVLIMTVVPGVGGQKFMESNLAKIETLSNKLGKDSNVIIEVDGGLNKENADRCKKAGARAIVSGSYIFNGNIKERVQSLLK